MTAQAAIAPATLSRRQIITCISLSTALVLALFLLPWNTLAFMAMNAALLMPSVMFIGLPLVASLALLCVLCKDVEGPSRAQDQAGPLFIASVFTLLFAWMATIAGPRIDRFTSPDIRSLYAAVAASDEVPLYVSFSFQQSPVSNLVQDLRSDDTTSREVLADTCVFLKSVDSRLWSMRINGQPRDKAACNPGVNQVEWTINPNAPRVSSLVDGTRWDQWTPSPL